MPRRLTSTATYAYLPPVYPSPETARTLAIADAGHMLGDIREDHELALRFLQGAREQAYCALLAGSPDRRTAVRLAFKRVGECDRHARRLSAAQREYDRLLAVPEYPSVHTGRRIARHLRKLRRMIEQAW